MFSQPVYHVSVIENTPVNTEILHVKATDSDERTKLSYSIHGSVDLVSMRMFRIDVGTGVIYTADVLDYEACTQHILTIMVRKNNHLHSPEMQIHTGFLLGYLPKSVCDSVKACGYKS